MYIIDYKSYLNIMGRNFFRILKAKTLRIDCLKDYNLYNWRSQ